MKIWKAMCIIIISGLLFSIIGFSIGYIGSPELNDWIGLIYGLTGFIIGIVFAVGWLGIRLIRQRKQ